MNRKNKENKLSFQGLVDKINLDELRSFVVDYSKNSKAFKSDFELYFAEKDEDFDIEEKCREQIRRAVKAHTYKQFIDYISSNKLAKELDDFLELGQEYIAKKNLLDASVFYMTCIQEIISVVTYADDSNGYIGDALYDGISLLEDVALQAPYALKEKVVAYLKKELMDDTYFDYGDYGYKMTELYAQLSLDLGIVDEFLQDIDLVLKRGGKDVTDYHNAFLTELKASILTKANRTGEADQLLEQEIHLPKVRRMVVEKVIDAEDYGQAKKLLAEGIRLAEEKKHPGTVHEWESFLLKIARLEKDIKLVRFFLEKFSFGRFLDVSYYHDWKSTYSSVEWEKVIEQKIASIKKAIVKDKQRLKWTSKEYCELFELGAIYIEEEMHGDLIMLVQQQDNLNTVLSYHKHLCKDFPTELMDTYVPLLDKEVERANDRGAYRSLMGTVLLIAGDIPSGKTALIEQMLGWKDQYKRRPAMIDEVNKVLAKIYA